MKNPLVSILIPFKNTGEFLPECLESILKQTYRNWEVLAVDDASSDQSPHILKEHAVKDPRIQVFPNPGKGIIPALRKALQQSKGKLITRMDSDDVMLPDRVGQMVALLIKNGPGHLAVGLVRYFSDRGINDGYQRYQDWLNELTAKGTNYTEIYKECVVPSPCWMAYREDLEKSGAFVPDIYPEDYDLTFRFYENDLKIIPCSEVLHLWRDYDHRTSRTSEHYSQNYFLELKVHYFLKLNHDRNRELAIWGAGFKGKAVVKQLLKNQIDFVWLCDNPNKINKKIYGKTLHHFEEMSSLKNPQSIITVANGTAQSEIRDYLGKLGQKPMEDYFFFC